MSLLDVKSDSDGETHVGETAKCVEEESVPWKHINGSEMSVDVEVFDISRNWVGSLIRHIYAQGLEHFSSLS